MLCSLELKSCLFLFLMTVFAQLVGVDVMAALDIYAERGQWEKCMETASRQVQVQLSQWMRSSRA